MSDKTLAILASNMNRLIGRDGVCSSNEVAQKASQGRVSRSTFDRLRNADKPGAVSVGIDKLDDVAKTFNVEAWQLFVPMLDIRALPRLASTKLPAFDTVDLEKLGALEKDQLAKIEGVIVYAAAQLGLDVKKDPAVEHKVDIGGQKT